MMSHPYRCPDPPPTCPDDTQTPLARSCSVSLSLWMPFIIYFSVQALSYPLCVSVCACITVWEKGLCMVYYQWAKYNVCHCKCLFSLPLLNTAFVPGYVHAYIRVCGVYTHLRMSVCVCVCVYDCLGSQRVTEPEFDEGTAVVFKGGWGLFPSITFSVFHKL